MLTSYLLNHSPLQYLYLEGMYKSIKKQHYTDERNQKYKVSKTTRWLVERVYESDLYLQETVVVYNVQNVVQKDGVCWCRAFQYRKLGGVLLVNAHFDVKTICVGK